MHLQLNYRVFLDLVSESKSQDPFTRDALYFTINQKDIRGKWKKHQLHCFIFY